MFTVTRELNSYRIIKEFLSESIKRYSVLEFADSICTNLDFGMFLSLVLLFLRGIYVISLELTWYKIDFLCLSNSNMVCGLLLSDKNIFNYLQSSSGIFFI